MIDWIDDDGYPTDDACNKVKDWHFTSVDDWQNLLLFVQSLWRYPDWCTFKETLGKAYNHYDWDISTGGWSGNEDLIRALEANNLFMAMCWEQSRRGGHYKFKVRKND
jgi:hypothetical protein